MHCWSLQQATWSTSYQTMFSEWRKTPSSFYSSRYLRASSLWCQQFYLCIWLAGNLLWESFSYAFLCHISLGSLILVPHFAYVQQPRQTNASPWWTRWFLGFVPSRRVHGRTNIEKKLNTCEGRCTWKMYNVVHNFQCWFIVWMGWGKDWANLSTVNWTMGCNIGLDSFQIHCQKIK